MYRATHSYNIYGKQSYTNVLGALLFLLSADILALLLLLLLFTSATNWFESSSLLLLLLSLSSLCWAPLSAGGWTMLRWSCAT